MNFNFIKLMPHVKMKMCIQYSLFIAKYTFTISHGCVVENIITIQEIQNITN